jgi:hypothetical protein
VWGWSPTLGKVGDLESSGTPECLELDNKAQNTLHWGVLGVIGKVLKRRYRKWPRIGKSDICSPSYGQKKGRESNWQFDSRPLKVENRPLPDIKYECPTWRATWRGLLPSLGHGGSYVSKRPWQVPTPKGVPNAKLTSRGWFFGCRFTQAKLVPLPSLIPWLPTQPSTPFYSWKPGACLSVSTFHNFTLVNPQVSSPRDQGARHSLHKDLQSSIQQFFLFYSAFLCGIIYRIYRQHVEEELTKSADYKAW